MNRIMKWWQVRRSPSLRWIKEMEKIDVSGAIKQGMEEGRANRSLGVALNSAKKGEMVDIALDPEVVKGAGITIFDTNEEATEKLRNYIERDK